MQTNQQGFPRITAPIADPDSGIVQQIWYQFFISLWQRTGAGAGDLPNPIDSITITGSPFRYEATTKGNLWIDPGAYCSVALTRGDMTLQYGYVTRGIFPMSLGDVITLTYDNFPPILHFI